MTPRARKSSGSRTATAVAVGHSSRNPPPTERPGIKVNPCLDSSLNHQALARLLAGEIAELKPVVTEPLVFIDQDLDTAQREVVARAVFTPDFFLLQIAPGLGRSRVLTEILNQTVARGERVFFLADQAATLDPVLSRLLHREAVVPLRFLEPGESPTMLPADLLPFTLLDRHGLAKEQNAAAAELAEIQHAVQALRPLVLAKQRGRWWTFAWWRATFRGQVMALMAERENRQRALEKTLYALARLPAENQNLLLQAANVLAGTMKAWPHDQSWVQTASIPFDLLVLENAEQFTEADILRLSRQAPRVILLGPSCEPDQYPQPIHDAGAANGTLRPGLGCFHKLWRELHRDVAPLPYAWSWEESRLCCSFRRLGSQDMPHLEIEPVADFPEIELRILAIPNETPLLAQVVFPTGMTVQQAKGFIYRELGEVAVQGLDRGASLAEEADRFSFRLNSAAPGQLACLDLEKGLREWADPVTGQTCYLEFMKPAGWSKALVANWLLERLQWRDLGRTMTLPG